MTRTSNLRPISILAVMGVISAATAQAELLVQTADVFELPTAAFDVGDPLSFSDDLAAALRAGDLADTPVKDIVLTAAVLSKVDEAVETTIGYASQSVETSLALKVDDDGHYLATITVGAMESLHVIGETELTAARAFVEEATTATKKTGIIAYLQDTLLRGEDDHLAKGQTPGHVTGYVSTGLAQAIWAPVSAFQSALRASVGHVGLTNARRCQSIAVV